MERWHVRGHPATGGGRLCCADAISSAPGARRGRLRGGLRGCGSGGLLPDRQPASATTTAILIDNQRAAGAVTLAVVVALAGYLGLRVGSESRGSLRPLIVGTAAATTIGLVAFALAILLVAVTGRA